MEELKIPTQGSNGTYCVTLSWRDDRLTVSCDCQAGKFNKLCKHKTGVLTGDVGILAEVAGQDGTSCMAKAQSILADAGMEAVAAFLAELRSLEAEKERIEKQIKARKADFALQLAEGLPKP